MGFNIFHSWIPRVSYLILWVPLICNVCIINNSETLCLEKRCLLCPGLFPETLLIHPLNTLILSVLEYSTSVTSSSTHLHSSTSTTYLRAQHHWGPLFLQELGYLPFLPLCHSYQTYYSSWNALILCAQFTSSFSGFVNALPRLNLIGAVSNIK